MLMLFSEVRNNLLSKMIPFNALFFFIDQEIDTYWGPPKGPTAGNYLCQSHWPDN